MRLLIVEDEVLVVMALAEVLQGHGVIVDRARSVAQALDLLDQHRPDAALLDIKLGNELVFPLVERIESIGVPFAFFSATRPDTIPERFRHAPQLSKPALAEDVVELLRRLAGLA